MALHAKRYVQTPAFEKLYDGWIESRFHAVNHGIKVDPDSAAMRGDVNAGMSEAAFAMSQAFAQLPAEQLGMLLKSDIDSLRNSKKDVDAKLLARYRAIEPLLRTNLAEARKQYAMAKTMQMSGATDEAQAQATLAAGAKASAERKRMEEHGA